MTCNTCTGGEHPILLKAGSTGGNGEVPKCFILSDQCFPPVLPAGEGGDCLAIVQIEDGTLMELACAFLDLTNGFDLPVGSVVVLSSPSQLARHGMALLRGSGRRTADPSV